MTTLWLHRMALYMGSKEGFISAKRIIQRKIDEQYYYLEKESVVLVNKSTTKENLLLIEARAAKAYWKKYKNTVPVWARFTNRKPHNEDIVNKFLDIGYHVLANKLEKLMQKHSISSSLAVLHIPHSEKSKPLVYDLMELFRVHVVDEEVITYLHRKKKPVLFPLPQKEFKQCHTYNYYIELQLLRYIHAVNHKKIFIPLYAPKRHENRCA